MVYSITKSPSTSTVPLAGGDVTYTLTVRSYTFGPLTNLAITDLLPVGEVEGHFHPPKADAKPQGTLTVNMGTATNVNVFRARFDPAVAGAHPFRLIVEGAESQPFWIELP